MGAHVSCVYVQYVPYLSRVLHVRKHMYVFLTVYMWVLIDKETADTQEAVQKLQEHNAGKET